MQTRNPDNPFIYIETTEELAVFEKIFSKIGDFVYRYPHANQ